MLTEWQTLAVRAYWQDDAACVGWPLEVFFGSEQYPLTPRSAAEGRRLCAACPVRRDCLLDALTTQERAGLRGGFLGAERKQTLERLRGDIHAAMRDYEAGVFYQPRRRRS